MKTKLSYYLNPQLVTLSSIEKRITIEDFLRRHILRFWNESDEGVKALQKSNPWPCWKEEGYFKMVPFGEVAQYLIPFCQLSSWMGCELWDGTREKFRNKLYRDPEIKNLLFRISDEESERIRVTQTLGMYRYATMTGSINLYTPDAVWHILMNYSDVGYNDTPETFRRVIRSEY